MDPEIMSSASRSTALLRAPVLLTMILFMVLPMGVAVVYSFLTNGAYGGVKLPFTTAAYLKLLVQEDLDGKLGFSPAYLIILWRSVLLAGLTVIISIIIGLPLAWYIACAAPAKRGRLLLLVTLPFWINTLIRTYCWVLILRDEGLVNQSLRRMGLIDGHIQFLYNDVAILLGMVYTYLPFMVLPIYAVLERLNGDIIEASHDLYADRWTTFRRMVWPIAMPGTIAGSLLVFAPALGSFLAPDLLGGGKRLMIGSLIQLQFSSSRNWPFGSALATVVSIGILLALFLVVRKNFEKVLGR
jgi:spermidine/putrescine transport system permease protein